MLSARSPTFLLRHPKYDDITFKQAQLLRTTSLHVSFGVPTMMLKLSFLDSLCDLPWVLEAPARVVPLDNLFNESYITAVYC
jgi:hypothetical protein